jgi:hypothetical protein
VRLSPLGTSATVWPIVPVTDEIDDECEAVGGTKIGRGNRSTRRKPAPSSLCPPQIPHDLTWDRTQAAVVGSRRLTAWAIMARPSSGMQQKMNLCLLVLPPEVPGSIPGATRFSEK